MSILRSKEYQETQEQYNKAVGAAIRQARVEKNLRMIDVAKKVGTTDATVSRWERGLTTIPQQHLDTIMDFLDIESDNNVVTVVEPQKVSVKFEALSNLEVIDLKKDLEIRFAQYSDDSYGIKIMSDNFDTNRLPVGSIVIFDPSVKPEDGNIVHCSIHNPQTNSYHVSLYKYKETESSISFSLVYNANNDVDYDDEETDVRFESRLDANRYVNVLGVAIAYQSDPRYRL